MSDTVSAAAIAAGQDERIRQRAYEIWESEGRSGHPEDHWYRAEREVSGTTQAPSEATVEDTPPVAAVEAMAADSEQPAGEAAAQKKPRRKRTT